MNIKSAMKVLEKERDKLASSRDKLRNLLSEIEEQEWNVSEALDDLNHCIDTLSEWV